MIRQHLKKFKVGEQPRSIVERNVVEDLLNKRKMLEDEQMEEEQVSLELLFAHNVKDLGQFCSSVCPNYCFVLLCSFFNFYTTLSDGTFVCCDLK